MWGRRKVISERATSIISQCAIGRLPENDCLSMWSYVTRVWSPKGLRGGGGGSVNCNYWTSSCVLMYLRFAQKGCGWRAYPFVATLGRNASFPKLPGNRLMKVVSRMPLLLVSSMLCPQLKTRTCLWDSYFWEASMYRVPNYTFSILNKINFYFPAFHFVPRNRMHDFSW
jgi:hypothetical protein